MYEAVIKINPEIEVTSLLKATSHSRNSTPGVNDSLGESSPWNDEVLLACLSMVYCCCSVFMALCAN